MIITFEVLYYVLKVDNGISRCHLLHKVGVAFLARKVSSLVSSVIFWASHFTFHFAVFRGFVMCLFSEQGYYGLFTCS